MKTKKCRSCGEQFVAEESDKEFCQECQKDIYDNGLPPTNLEEEET